MDARAPSYSTAWPSIQGQVSPQEWQARCDLAACYRLMDLHGMTDMIYNHITLRIPGTDHLLINLYGLLYREITATSLAKITCPVLAVIGEKDVQVDPGLNLPAIRQALAAGGNADATVEELPGLNHLFQTCTTGAVSEYDRIEETFAPVSLTTVRDWLVKRLGGK
jgi:pimeloyl-ACP methyl ester carboxylesterase